MCAPSLTSNFDYPGCQSITDDVWIRLENLVDEGRHGPPDGGRSHRTDGSINVALLPEGGSHRTDRSINIALLTQGRSHRTDGSINMALLPEGGDISIRVL